MAARRILPPAALCSIRPPGNPTGAHALFRLRHRPAHPGDRVPDRPPGSSAPCDDLNDSVRDPHARVPARGPSVSDLPGAAPAGEGLVGALGLGSAILFVLGSVIGSGIFLTRGVMALALPSPALIIAAWVMGGVIALSGGLTYAEMGSMFPRSGGVYVYLREAFGPLIAFLYGWAALFVFFSGGIAAVAVGFADYVSYFMPALSSSRVLGSVATPAGTWTLSAAQIVAVTSIAALAAINYVGVRSGNRVNIILTVAKVAGLAALPILALVASHTAPAWVPVVPPDLARPLPGFGIAMIAVLWTNDAWYCVTWIAGEMKQPQRDLPRALLIGITLLTLIYVIANLAYLYALPMSELKGVSRVAERAATALVGVNGARFVALTVVLSTFGCNNAAILAGARPPLPAVRRGRVVAPPPPRPPPAPPPPPPPPSALPS